MIKAIYDQEKRLLIIPGDFTGRLKDFTSQPLISYEIRNKLSLASEMTSLIPYSIMPDSKIRKGQEVQEVPAKMTYRAGSLEAASIMVDKIKNMFDLSIELENDSNKDEKKYQILMEKLN